LALAWGLRRPERISVLPALGAARIAGVAFSGAVGLAG